MVRHRCTARVLALACLCSIAPLPALAQPWEPSSSGLTGSLGDANCNVEAVEFANSAQLSSILTQLLNSTYFRLFKVNLDGECRFWRKDSEKPAGAAEKEEQQQRQEEPQLCTAPPEEDDAPPACALTGGDDGDLPFAAASAETGAPSAPQTSQVVDGMHSFPWMPMSNAVDRTLSSHEDRLLLDSHEGPCDASSPTFWLDMCSNIATNVSEYVNLQLNPERWTGYNGSHVWDAIYQENCFVQTATDVEQMCYEERVLYRMLSGMHASINIHIALNYKPPKRGVRDTWESNPRRFVEQYAPHPERLKNMYFSYVVLLRALRKASPYLYSFPFRLGVPEEDERTEALVRRLLDSHILSDCGPVFEAFDETLMFEELPGDSASAVLKSQFKGVFHNISAVMDCISCQKCKLHGKLQLLGIGTALKILLVPEQLIATSLAREELVALFNTIGKFSASIAAVSELSQDFWAAKQAEEPTAVPSPPVEQKAAAAAAARFEKQMQMQTDVEGSPTPAASELFRLMDAALGVVVRAKSGLTHPQEDALVDATLAGDARTLLLAKHYGGDVAQFTRHALRQLATAAGAGPSHAGATAAGTAVDAVVVGGGLAGLSAALTLLDRGGRVLLLEKEAFVGGNTLWASSGINGVDAEDPDNADSVGAYANDTLVSGGQTANPLVQALAEGSVGTLHWLRSRVHVPLDRVSQLGGHSHARTHRPSSGLAGSELVNALKRQLGVYERQGQLTVMKKTRATRLLLDKGQGGTSAVTGLEWARVGDGDVTGSVRARAVVLATGGYANDHTDSSLLARYRPDLVKFATTNTKGTTGDGHKLALAAGAAAVDMEHVQVHPTGFIDPKEEAASTKTLCAELLRGTGAVLLDRQGRRFVNELGTRDHISAEMMARDPQALDFVILLTAEQAALADKHVPMYVNKGLLNHFSTLDDLTAWMRERGNVTREALRETLTEYVAAAAAGAADAYGKVFFHHAEGFAADGPWVAGRVTPVVHYSMGGLAVDDGGRVLTEEGGVVAGLWAAGEVMGGLHGKNRLGGNALTECAVFGRAVGAAIPVGGGDDAGLGTPGEAVGVAAGATEGAAAAAAAPRSITAAELASHNTAASCWVSIDGQVYDFSEFLEEHPAGAQSILDYGGQDGTVVFDTIHSRSMLDDFEPIGVLSGATE